MIVPNSKTNHCNYLECSPYIYIIVINTWLCFQNIDFFELFIDDLKFPIFQGIFFRNVNKNFLAQ